jgi:hypothetical protein
MQSVDPFESYEELRGNAVGWRWRRRGETILVAASHGLEE